MVNIVLGLCVSVTVVNIVVVYVPGASPDVLTGRDAVTGMVTEGAKDSPVVGLLVSSVSLVGTDDALSVPCPELRVTYPEGVVDSTSVTVTTINDVVPLCVEPGIVVPGTLYPAIVVPGITEAEIVDPGMVESLVE